MKETKLHSYRFVTMNSKQKSIVSRNNGLKMYLSGLSVGREATPRSNLYNLKGSTQLLTPEQILAKWKHQLESLSHGDSRDKLVYQFDSHQLEKWGPQGEVAPIDELMEDIVIPTFTGSNETPPAFQDDNWRLAKRQVVKYLHNSGCKGLSPVPYKNVVDNMRARDTLESNSGWPLFTRRKKPEVVRQSIQEAENGLWKTYPAIALFRNYNRKTRLVWMFPMSANLVEGSFFQPLQMRLESTNFPAAKNFLAPWHGFSDVRARVTHCYTRQYKHAFLAASDFSSTDAHFQLATSMEVFDVLKECFQPRFREKLRESIEYMHTIPLVVGVNKILIGKHGVSSGSNWTNFIETIFDWILAEYVSLTLGPNVRGFYAIGDDMTWRTHNWEKELTDKLEKIGKSVGQVIKAEKTTYNPDNVVSLQRLFIRNYLRPDGEVRAIYPTIRALKSLVYPEKFHSPKVWNKDMEAIRAFMILENCVDHPYFKEFCRFVSEGDPHLQEVARYSTSKIARLQRESKLVPGLNTTYNQERRDQSLTSFESVKLISKM